jgi:phi LC3 family holin
MKLNWKVRFKNAPWLTCFIMAILSFIYTILGMFDIYPQITQDQVGKMVAAVIQFLSLTGVLIDPTTDGIGDSKRAMGYDEPWQDAEDEE